MPIEIILGIIAVVVIGLVVWCLFALVHWLFQIPIIIVVLALIGWGVYKFFIVDEDKK